MNYTEIEILLLRVFLFFVLLAPLLGLYMLVLNVKDMIKLWKESE